MKTQITVSTIIFVLVTGSAFADDPPFEDEDILGLEISGELLAPPALVSQIGQDLAAIRSAFPEISDIHVLPSWLPGEVVVGLTHDAWAEYQAGTFAELDSLNAEYGAVFIHPIDSIRVLSIGFGSLYHPVLLAEIYETIDGVRYAEPNSIMGDGSDIFSEQLPIYTFKRGWGDCPSGCIFNDYWVFAVNGGFVELIDHYGSSVSAVGPGQVGQETSILGIAPNPFNPSTTIKYHLDQANWVRLEVYDVRGRSIATLVNEYVYPGEHEVIWHGSDGSGSPVASGLYFCRLDFDGVAQVQEMSLLK